MVDKPPKLSIAWATDEYTLALRRQREARKQQREQHRERIESITRELAANMLDVMRGAGDVKDLPEQVRALWQAIEQSPDEIAYEAVAEAMQATLQGLRTATTCHGNLP